MGTHKKSGGHLSWVPSSCEIQQSNRYSILDLNDFPSVTGSHSPSVHHSVHRPTSFFTSCANMSVRVSEKKNCADPHVLEDLIVLSLDCPNSHQLWFGRNDKPLSHRVRCKKYLGRRLGTELLFAHTQLLISENFGGETLEAELELVAE